MVAGLQPGDEKTAFNRERAEHRRSVARAVRSERERLTSFTGTRPAFDYELVLTYARNRIGTAYAIPLLVAIVAATGAAWIEPGAVIAWGAVVLAFHVATFALCRKFSGVPETSAATTRKWVWRFVLADGLGGIAWAAMLILVPIYAEPGSGLEIFQFAMTLMVISVTTTLASTIPAAAVAGSVPVTLTLAALYVHHGQFLLVALAVMALGAQAFFLVLASRLYQSTLTMLEYRAEKDLLIAELGTAKSISDESRRRAEEANLAKSRFLATMSHELRTPLNAILGFSEVMKKGVLGTMENATYRDYVSDIHSSGEHLLNLINEILDLSRIEAGRHELYEEALNLVDAVEECRHLLQLRARNKGLIVTENYQRGMARLWADERAVRQIVLNLLANAIKFTPTDGEIAIEVGQTANGGQYFSIRDNGPGIPAEEIPIVLSPFGQGSAAIKSAEQGAGLGLPIVQALMRMHDGTFELRSKLREGTEAICTFPLSRVMEALPPINDDKDGSWRRTG